MRHYLIVTASYWGFTLVDGALRMLVLLHFFQLGYSPFTLAFLFLLYEFAGIVANLAGMAEGLDRDTVAVAVPAVYAVALASPLLAMLASWRLLALRTRGADERDVAVQVQAGGGQAEP